MTSHPKTLSLILPWAPLAGRLMEFLQLLTVFLVPLMFVSPGRMTNGFDAPKVTLYRSLVGLIGALWIIEGSLIPSAFGAGIPKFSPSVLREWLRAQPGRWLMVAAWMLLASNLISTLLSTRYQ